MSLYPDLPIGDFIHEVWRMEEGLPQNTVNSIIQTRDGYLWLATQEGLARFDGARFVVFDRSNTEGIGHNSIQVLLESGDGGLWIGTYGGGLSRFKDGRFMHYGTGEGLSGEIVRALCEDRDGTLWIGTGGGGLNRFRDGAFTAFTTEEGLPSDFVRSIYEDPDGALWIGTSVGLSRLKDGEFTSFTVRHGLTDSMVTSIVGDPAGGLWIGTSGGLIRYQGGRFTTFTEREGLSSDLVISLYEDPEGCLWVGTNGGGVNRLVNGAVFSLTSSDGLSDDVVRSFLQDREGSLWIGTLGGGLNRLRKGKFSTWTTADGLSDDAVFSVFESRDGSVWVGTLGGGLNRIREEKVDVFTTKEGLSSDLVVALEEDREGTLWIGTNGEGLNRYGNGRFTAYRRANGLSNDRVYSICEGGDGSVWIGTDGGLNRFKDGTFTVYTREDGLSVNSVGPILEGFDGTLWIGTDGGGLNQLRDGRFSVYTMSDGLSSDFIWSLHEGQDGTLWIGTRGGGLDRMKEGRITTFTTHKGFFNDAVFSILEDDGSNLWMTCNKGVFRVNIRELEDFAEGRAGSFHTVSYGVADGMKSGECNGGGQPAAWRMADGSLWFSTTKGAAIIHPDKIEINSLPPPVVFEDLIVDEQPFPMDLDELTRIPPGKERFEFHYTALSFLVPERVRFKYMLEGHDRDWVDAGARRVAYYTRIPAGDYTFRVIASNDDGVWNEEGTSFQLTIVPSFWETAWFKILAAGAFLLLVFLVYRLRLRYIEANRKELMLQVAGRTRELETSRNELQALNVELKSANEKIQEADRLKSDFLAKMSHELRTPLNSIIGFSDIMLQGVTGDILPKQRKCITNISISGKHLLQLINNLLDLSKIEAGKMELHPEPCDLKEEVRSVKAGISSLLDKKGHVLDTEFEEDLPDLYADIGVVKQILLNLLSNAHKFAQEEGRIVVGAKVSRDQPEFVEVSVADTGQGIRAEDLPHVFDEFMQGGATATCGEKGTGLGLALCKKFVQMHGGGIWAESEYGRGSRFCFTLPMVKIEAAREEG